MGTGRGARSGARTGGRRPAIGIAVVGAIGVVAAALAALGGSRPPVSPGPPQPGSGAIPAVVGPTVFYEILDADGSALVERRLDGHSLPRRIATRPDADLGQTWTIDPGGTIAVAILPTDGQQERVEAVEIADGADLWQVELPFTAISEAVWSADGHRLALISRPDQAGPTESFVVDTRGGRVTRTVVPQGAVLQGFDVDDALLLREAQGDGTVSAWTFLRVDPATNVVERLSAVPDVGPSTTGAEDVDPARGFAVTLSLGPNHRGTAVHARPTNGGAARQLGVFPSVDWIAIDPSGTGVAVAASHGLRFIAWDGRAEDLWSSDDSIAGFGWSADGDYLWIETDRRGPNLTVIERSTGRTIVVPQVDPVAQSLVVRVVGGVSLPDTALPAVEPTPAPTPAPSGPDVADAPSIASAWVDASGGRTLLHVDRLVPTSEGGMRVAASMTPVPVADDPDTMVALLPRPRSAQVLAWVGTADHAMGWLWDGITDHPSVRLAVPRDWPASAFALAWRPDGQAVAAMATRVGPDGDVRGTFVIAELGAARTTFLPFNPQYDRLEGWWSSTELRVGHVICTEGCEGRFSYSARLRVRDGRLRRLTPADRTHAPIDEIDPDGRGGLVMSVINADPADDVRIDWPLGSGSVDGPAVIGFARGGRSILLADASGDGTDLYRIDDAAQRAVKGRLADPQPVRLGHLPRHGLDVRISPDQRWALVVDRVENVQLVELSTGRAWQVDRDRTLDWWPTT